MTFTPEQLVAVVVAILGAGGLGGLLTLYWTKGSEARIREMNARAKLLAEENTKTKLDIDEVADRYEDMLVKSNEVHTKSIGELKEEQLKQIAAQQAHVDIMDKKLDAAESRERECLERAARAEGRLSGLEEKVKALECDSKSSIILDDKIMRALSRIAKREGSIKPDETAPGDG